MRDVSEISLFVSNQFETIRAISLDQPLKIVQKVAVFPLLPSRKNRIALFAAKMIHWFSLNKQSSAEQLFLTAVALLIAEPLWRTMILKTEKMRTHFLNVVHQIAHVYGVTCDETDIETIERQIQDSTYLKTLAHSKRILGEAKIQQVQCLLLDELEKLPISSTLNITCVDGQSCIRFKTSYVKYKVHAIEPSGHIIYHCQIDKNTSSIRTQQSIFPDIRGVIGQRIVQSDCGTMSSSSGELSTRYHVLEQILCLLQLTSEEVSLLPSRSAPEKCILFTSLYAWHELDLILEQKEAIESLNGLLLSSEKGAYRLRLLYMNIPLNVWSRLPAPAETTAVLRDLNDQALIWLTYATFLQLELPREQLRTWVDAFDTIDKDFFHAAQMRLGLIDAFNQYKVDLIPYLQRQGAHLAQIVVALLTQKRPDGKALRGIDTLLYLEQLTTSLRILHHKNCQRATHRSSAAHAADKAQYAFTKIAQAPFLPGAASDEQHKLFEALYSLYLLWEEPTMHHILNTGEEGSFETTLCKNSEISRYLI